MSVYVYRSDANLSTTSPIGDGKRILDLLLTQGPLTALTVARRLTVSRDRAQTVLCSLAEAGRVTAFTFPGRTLWRAGGPGCVRCQTCTRPGAMR